MKISLKVIYICTIVLCSFNGIAQQKNNLPVSIYASKDDLSVKQGVFYIDNKLNINNLQFLIVNTNDIKSGLFSIDTRNFGRTATAFVYDSYSKLIFNETSVYYDPKKPAFLPKDIANPSF